MSRLRKYPKLMWNTLLSALCAWGLGGIYASAMPFTGGAVLLPLTALMASLALGILDVLLPKRLTVAALLGMCAVECVLFLQGMGVVHAGVQAVSALYLHFGGVTGALLPYGREMALLLGTFFSIICYFLLRDDAFGFAAGCLLTLTVLGLYLSRGLGILYALPVLLSLLVVLSAAGGRRMAAWLLCPLIALGAFMLLPDEGTTLKPLETMADDLRNMVEDYFFFTDTRDSFTLHSTGYQPLQNRLGGTAVPVSGDVMTVEGTPNASIYLRASSMNEYTGLNWYDTLSGRRYLFTSSVYEELRRDVFDMALPMGLEDENTHSVTVTMQKNDTTTLFTPQRIRNISMLSERMVPYFNDAGELYITRNLTAGDSYTVDYLPLDITKRDTRTLIRENAGAQDPRMADAESKYLTVPQHIQQEVWDIAQKAASGITSPLDKALAIRDYLIDHYDYTLEVTEPPSSVDFVAYFLLGPEKTGYCTYFASAQTVLCRMAGVPARYVVGYLAQTDDMGQAMLTGANAHAWTEIYLNGVGWVTLDATPGNQEDWEEDPRQDPNDGPSEQGETPDETPTPSPSPTPTPTPEPEAPSPSPDAQTPTPTPDATPEPTPQWETPTPSPLPDAAPEDEQNDDPHPFRWWWLLLLLLLVPIIWYVMASPDKRAARHPDKAGDIYFAACLCMLKVMHLMRRPDETLLSFAARARNQCGVPLDHLFTAASAGIYGKDKRIERRTAENALRMLLKKATSWQHFRMRVRMMFLKVR